MTTYEASLAKHQADQAAQAKDRQNRQVWREILSRYDIADNIANYNRVLQYCSGEMGVQKFDWMMRNDKPFAKTLDWRDQREELTEKILALIREHGPRMTEHDLLTWRTKLKFFTTDQLRDKLTEAATRQAFNERPVSELYDALAEHRKAQSTTTFEGYQRIPDTIVPPWTTQAIPMKQYLDRIAKTDVLLLKRAVKLWGHRQVDSVRRGF